VFDASIYGKTDRLKLIEHKARIHSGVEVTAIKERLILAEHIATIFGRSKLPDYILGRTVIVSAKNRSLIISAKIRTITV